MVSSKTITAVRFILLIAGLFWLLIGVLPYAIAVQYHLVPGSVMVVNTEFYITMLLINSGIFVIILVSWLWLRNYE